MTAKVYQLSTIEVHAALLRNNKVRIVYQMMYFYSNVVHREIRMVIGLTFERPYWIRGLNLMIAK